MAHLKELSLESLTEEHLRAIAKVAAEDYYGASVRSVLLEAVKGEISIWELSEGEGLFGLRLVERPGGRELWVDFAVGKDLLEKAELVREVLMERARMAGARWYSWQTPRRGLGKFYEKRFGVKPSLLVFSEEV